jgi:hypothetical protein
MGHLDPIELFLDAMKRVVADFVTGPHRQHRLPRGVECVTMESFVDGPRRVGRFSVEVRGHQVPGELLPDRVTNHGFNVGDAREPGVQRSFTRRPELAANRIIVVQVERA